MSSNEQESDSSLYKDMAVTIGKWIGLKALLLICLAIVLWIDYGNALFDTTEWYLYREGGRVWSSLGQAVRFNEKSSV